MTKKTLRKDDGGKKMNIENLQMFAGGAETGSSGLSGDFDADFAKYVSHTDSARQDAAVENDDADTDAADENPQ